MYLNVIYVKKRIITKLSVLKMSKLTIRLQLVIVYKNVRW